MIQSSIHRRSSAAASASKRAAVPATAAGVNHTSGWIDSGAWRLPSGKALSEFALQAGFLVPHLFGAEGRSPLVGTLALARESGKRAG
jgi:hypothetical protein